MQNPSESRDPGKQVCRSDLKQAIERQIKNKVRGQEVGLITTMMTLAENCSKCGKKSPSDRDLPALDIFPSMDRRRKEIPNPSLPGPEHLFYSYALIYR